MIDPRVLDDGFHHKVCFCFYKGRIYWYGVCAMGYSRCVSRLLCLKNAWGVIGEGSRSVWVT